MSERRSPLKISPEKRKWARVGPGMDEESGSSPRKKSSSSSTTPSGSQPSGRSSPEPNCPICLGGIEFKAFAHGCFHSFCRTCLFEWSKIKPECPVCRQPFTRIIFNVKSMSEYDEHVVPSRVPPTLDRGSFHFWAMHNLGPSSNPASQSFQRLMAMDEVYGMPAIAPFIPAPVHQYASSSSSAAVAGPSRSSISYRITVSPRQQMWPESVTRVTSFSNDNQPYMTSSGHLRLTSTHRGTHLTVAPSTSADYQPFPPVPGSSAFRRYVYDYNLWAKYDSSRGVRASSAKFYRDNPALTHRLITFVNRELNAILDSCQQLLPEVISLLTKYDIRSRKFRRIVEPHLVRRTDQFIHEVHSFAVSTCHDMMDYDNRVVYVRKEQTKIFTTEPPVPPLGFSYEVESSESEDERPISFKSNNSSVIEILDSDDEAQVQIPEEAQTQLQPHEEEVLTEVVTETTVAIPDSELFINIVDFDNPRPGPSGLSSRNMELVRRPPRPHISDSESDLDVGRETELQANLKSAVLDDSDSGESVQIIGSKKALRRTPVVIDLSDTDSDADVSSGRNRKHKKRKHRNRILDISKPRPFKLCPESPRKEEKPELVKISESTSSTKSGKTAALKSGVVINGKSSKNNMISDGEGVQESESVESETIGSSECLNQEIKEKSKETIPSSETDNVPDTTNLANNESSNIE